jgi:uncharacterized protein YaiE (UPF0345 family)
MFHRKKGEPRVFKGKKRTLRKRGGALLLSLALLVTMLPMSAYADETGTSNEYSQDVITGETQGGYGDEGESTEGNEGDVIVTENPEGDEMPEGTNEEDVNEETPIEETPEVVEPVEGEEETPEEETTNNWIETLPLQEVMVVTYDAIDNVALFQAYVEQLLQGVSGFDSSVQLGAASEGAQLTGASKNAYQLILNQMEQIANGSSTTTTVTLSAQELGILGGWSMDELDLEPFADEAQITYALAEKLWMELDYKAVLASLRIDLSKALYWFDPSYGVSIQLQVGMRQTEEATQVMVLGVQFRFAVEEMFQGQGGRYTTDASWILDAEAALAKINGYTLSQVSNPASTEPSNGEEGEVGVQTLEGEDAISVQADINNIPNGKVKNIVVEKDFEETALDDLEFRGGEINVDTAPTDQDRSELVLTKFYKAYVQSSTGERYEISHIGSRVEGENTNVYYVLADGSTSNIKATIKLTTSDKVIFSYKSTTTSYQVSYTCLNETNTKLLTDTMLTSLGGFRNLAQLVRRVNTISNGQVIYFQIRRLPGTNLNVQARNSDGTSATITDVTDRNTSGDTEFVNTYRLSGTRGNVAITYSSTWKKTSFNVSLTMRSVAYTSKAAMAGSLKVEEYYANSVSQGKNIEKQANTSDTRTVLALTTTSTMQTNIQRNSAIFSKIHNTIYAAKENPKWYQVLSGMSVGKEAIALPTAPGATTVTTLTKGEAYGTTIAVTMERTLDTLTGVSTTAKVPVYTILVYNLHADISIQMEYSPMGSKQATYAIMDTTGVEAELYLKQDWVTPNKILWQSLSAGTYYYEKNAVTPGTNASEYVYTIRWKNKPGYYNSTLTIVANNAQGVLTTYTYYTSDTSTATGGKKRVTLGSDGYYTVKLSDLKAQLNSIAYVSFSATPLYYSVTYDANGGNYDNSSKPSDTKIYDSALDNQLIISKLRPERATNTATKTGYVFTGYRILEDASGTVYKPGTTVDLSKLRLSVSSTNQPKLTNGKLTITLTVQAVWRELQGGETTEISGQSKYQIKVGTIAYDVEFWSNSTQSGKDVTFTYPLTIGSGESLLKYVGTTTESGVVTLLYQHPAPVTVSIDTSKIDMKVSLPTTEFDDTHAYQEVDLSKIVVEELDAEYAHIGWKDRNTGTIYYLDGTTTQNLDENSGIAVLSEDTVEDAGIAVLSEDTVEEGYALIDTMDEGYAVVDTMDEVDAVAMLDDSVILPEEGIWVENDETASTSSGGTMMVIADENGMPISIYDPNTFQQSVDTTVVTQENGTNIVKIPWEGLDLEPVLETLQINEVPISITSKTADSMFKTSGNTFEKSQSEILTWLINDIQVNPIVVDPLTGVEKRKASIASIVKSQDGTKYSITFSSEQSTQTPISTQSQISTYASGTTTLTKTITVNVFTETVEAQNAFLSQSRVEELLKLSASEIAAALIQQMGANAWVTGNKDQTVAITSVDSSQLVAQAGEYTIKFTTANGYSTTAQAVVPAVAVSVPDEEPAFFATTPGQSVQQALEAEGSTVLQALAAVGITSSAAVQKAIDNFVVIGPSGISISGASGTGYILANSNGTGYTLPGAGGNFLITGTRETGFQVLAPSGQTFDVIGDNDTGFILVSQDKQLFTVRGNSVTGFYVVALSDVVAEEAAETTSPLTDGKLRNIYLFGFAGGMLLALFCVLQWSSSKKKIR